ncbi:hypothetical protein GCM10027034_39430 [Ramlibacter solisilvae]|uniref:Uncharacterized protein n=1 Tax=Ramlibacter tataouinensis TaxID=94132 RepID=A0A127JU95_9BURK|nr:hypothetical protein [Ramlibacter tataouinensis]AMO23541.1 hypothetical protein UC35_12355 [Ramlibacter tataouinensis]
MPSAKDRAKATGDTHLPEIEPEEFQTHKPRPAWAGVPGSRIRASRRDDIGEKNSDATGEGRGEARDSAES